MRIFILLLNIINFTTIFADEYINIKKNIRIVGHQKATDHFILTWNAVPHAKKYIVSMATLKNSTITNPKLKLSDFKYITTTSKPSAKITITNIPIRRYVFLVQSFDGKELLISDLSSDIVYRYPRNVKEFLKDVDFTIVHAIRQIPNFGLAGSQQKVRGLAQGVYDYSASILHSKSNWENYSSFEIILNGSPTITIIPYPVGAAMSGTVKISGLYTGEIIYNKLIGLSGGITASGSITARYLNPSKGWEVETFNYKEASSFLKSVISDLREIQHKVVFDIGVGD